MFGLRFVDKSKLSNIGVRYKSSLVAQRFKDTETATMETKTPTLQQLTQWLILSMAALHEYGNAHAQDITQA